MLHPRIFNFEAMPRYFSDGQAQGINRWLPSTHILFKPIVPHTCTGYFFLIIPPYLYISAGNGIIPTAINPNRLLPQPKPRVSYIEGPANGKTAPKRHRIAVKPATAEAA